MDLDSDNKVIPSNKYREAYNVDIRKSGNVFSLTDLKGETILSEIENVSDYSVSILNVTEAQFFISPTSKTEDALIFFYTKHKGSDRRFVIKAIFMNDFRQSILYSETVSSYDLDILLKSTVDVEKVGQYGYDVLYFVDNRRQPRRLECVIHTTNESEVSITIDSLIDNTGYKTVNIILDSTVEPVDPFRVYVYSYLEGGSAESSSNILTESIKYAEFGVNDLQKSLSFNIYEEDYGTRYFQIRYHKDGNTYYRNFTIGTPSIASIDIGVLYDSFNIMSSNSLTGAITQSASWDFLYDGIVVSSFVDEFPVVTGSTSIYKNNVEASFNILEDGYYQAITEANENKYIKVEGGIITEYQTNWANVSLSITPVSIATDVRSLSTTITEGIFNRLSQLSYSLPSNLTSNTEDYVLTKIYTDTKEAAISNYSYVMERNGDQSPVAQYDNTNIYLYVETTDIESLGSNQYSMIIRASLSKPLEAELGANVKQRIYAGAIEQSSAYAFIVIPEGEISGHMQVSYTASEAISFGQVCVESFEYAGSETVIPENQCPI